MGHPSTTVAPSMTVAPSDEPRPGAAAPMTVPDAVGAIGSELTGLSEAHSAEDRDFLVDGGALWIAGVESRPGFRVGEGTHVLATVQVGGLGAAANVLLFPGVARRQSVGPRGTVLETLVTSPRLPLVVAQWAGGGAGSHRARTDRTTTDGSPDETSGRTPEKIVVEVAPPMADAASTDPAVEDEASGEHDGPVHPPIVERHADHVTLEVRGRVTAVALSPEPAAIHTRPRSDGGLRVVFTPSQEGRTSLLVAVGSRDRIGTYLAGGRHARAHATRAAAGPQDGLTLRSGVAEIDDGFLWLRSRLAGQARRARSPEPALGLATLGVGDRDSAERLLALGESTSAVHALMAARFASVLGDTGPAARVADHWRGNGPPTEHPLTGLAAGSLADALDHVSHPDLIAELRALSVSSPSTAPGERRLPTLGGRGPSEDRGERWWRGVLVGDPAPPVPPHSRPAVVEAREACAGFATDPDRAWVVWRGLVSSVPEDRRATTTLWDPLPDATADGARRDPARSHAAAPEDARSSLTSELVLAIVCGLLGIRADAAVGRLRLAPRLPSHVRSFGVGGIPVGSSSLGMEYRRGDRLHTFELLPERAAVPPLVVFEPSVPGVVEEVRIDGASADLELEVVGGRTTIPVQLPVDRPRKLEIRT